MKKYMSKNLFHSESKHRKGLVKRGHESSHAMHIVNVFLLTLQFFSGTAFDLRPGFMGANLPGTKDPINLDVISPSIDVSGTKNEDKHQATEAITFSVVNQLHLGHSGTATSTPTSSHWSRRLAFSPWIVKGHGITHTMHIVKCFHRTLQALR
ncbi:uncharacterized protein ISCGN_027190 [Ixodes scapularis]